VLFNTIPAARNAAEASSRKRETFLEMLSKTSSFVMVETAGYTSRQLRFLSAYNDDK